MSFMSSENYQTCFIKLPNSDCLSETRSGVNSINRPYLKNEESLKKQVIFKTLIALLFQKCPSFLNSHKIKEMKMVESKAKMLSTV